MFSNIHAHCKLHSKGLPLLECTEFEIQSLKSLTLNCLVPLMRLRITALIVMVNVVTNLTVSRITKETRLWVLL